jgi:hypothetical protein
MKRPIGVILLTIGAGIAAVYQLYLAAVYMGWVNFPIGNQEVSFDEAQWGAALWSLLIAAIWIWVAAGFWNLRAYAVSFGIFISLFTLIWGFFALLFGNTYEAQTIPWLLAGVIFLYLSYPGVQQHFVASERSRLTPEQIEAMEALDRANANAAAQQAPGMESGPAAQPPEQPPKPPASGSTS